jgi:hypothetical protein
LNDFLGYEPEKTTTDQGSYKLQVLVLYRRLLTLLTNRGEAGPVIRTELERLKFVRENSAGADAGALFKQRLLEITEIYKDHPDSTQALYELAEMEYHHNLSRSMKCCEEALRRFPDSAGAMECQKIKQRILEKFFAVQVGSTITGADSELKVNYRNLGKLHFRVLPDSFDRFLRREDQIQDRGWWAKTVNSCGFLKDYIEKREMKAMLRKKPVLSWSADLPPTGDYGAGETIIPVPELPPGFYRLLVSGREDFRERPDNQILYENFQVTNTMLLLRRESGGVELMVLNALSGEPLADETVQTFWEKKTAGMPKLGKEQHFCCLPGRSFKTDQNGIVFIRPENPDEDRRLMIFVKAETGAVMLHEPISIYFSEQKPVQKQMTAFFTDRAIYRPGQTIQFKGVCFNRNYEDCNYDVLSRRTVLVSLLDHNFQVVDEAEFVSGEFGSFFGSFTAPEGVLTGKMTLVTEDPFGFVSFKLEEYKRPKFEVSLNLPDKEFRLHDEVEIKGFAASFSGVPLSGAAVKYHVTRKIRRNFGNWYKHSKDENEIDHGELKTNADGGFCIRFIALPDLSLAPESNSSFVYELSVDVTDSTGETRSSSQKIRLGYFSSEACLSVPEWLEADEEVPFTVRFNTLDNRPLKNSGTISIYSLKPQERLLRTIPCHTGDDGLSVVREKLDAGAYKAVLTTRDLSGKEISHEIALLVFSLHADSFTLPVPPFFRVKNTTVESGSHLEAVFGTGYENACIYVACRRDDRLLPVSGWRKNAGSFFRLKLPVTEELKGGFTLEMIFVRENRSYIFQQFISVPRQDKKLQLSFATFRNRLSPGLPETWTVKIAGPAAERTAVEMAATLYDASLDKFAPHSWSDFQGFFFHDRISPVLTSDRVLQKLLSFCEYSEPRSGFCYSRYRPYPALPPDICDGISP